MILENIANSPLIENLSWTLLHSIWQIAFASFWLFLTLRILAKSSANSRYAFSLAALIFSIVLPLVTFFWLSNNSAKTAQNFTASDTDNSFVSKQQLQPAEDFLPNGDAKLPDAKNENYFVSMENLQNNFTANFLELSPFLVGFWFLGIAFFAFRFAGGAWQLHVYKTREISAPSREWQDKFLVLSEKFKIKQTVKLVQSKIIETPMVIGWLKPVILIPASVFLQVNPQELETIVAHELVHIRRYDYLTNLAQSFVEILFFYHPAMWWISAQIRRERECACDDAVVRILENSELVYAKALANLEEFRHSAKQTTPSILVAANGGNLMKRIERIIHKKNARTGRSQHSLWSASLASALILALMLGIFSATTNISVNAQKSPEVRKTKKIAVGFVSIPPVDRMENPPKDSDATARLLIEKLKAHRVPATGFVQGNMISDGEKSYPVRANIVRLWRDAGFEIGIGGYKHIWFYHTPYDDYVTNTEKNEKIVREILAEKNLPLRYFSYPFLNTGKSTEDKTKFEAWLKERNLQSIKYTFDNQEWMYSYAYDMARKDNDINTMREIRGEFVDYMTKMLEHYEAYSQEMFGRDIAQTMVLTPSRLVADSFDDVFGMLEKHGYEFVGIDKAQADEAYRMPDEFSGKAGISWFERWQLGQGKKIRAEPEVSKSVADAWNNRKDKNAPLPPKPPAPPKPVAPSQPPAPPAPPDKVQ
jgi:beta-lactamase regulating signal transducer with metallopeptidase domain